MLKKNLSLTDLLYAKQNKLKCTCMNVTFAFMKIVIKNYNEMIHYFKICKPCAMLCIVPAQKIQALWKCILRNIFIQFVALYIVETDIDCISLLYFVKNDCII